MKIPTIKTRLSSFWNVLSCQMLETMQALALAHVHVQSVRQIMHVFIALNKFAQKPNVFVKYKI
jgi:hypothetical protein